MLLGEVKDVVREHFGRVGLPTTILDISLAEGRKLVEKEANFWWMRDITDFSAGVDQQEYTIGDGEDVDIDNFKDARALQYKLSTANDWESIELGVMDEEELNELYSEDDEGPPEHAVIDNVTLKLFPANPQFVYDMRLYHYNWTDNPTDNTETDDLIRNYGMALVYGACLWGYEMQLKDLQAAQYWRNLLLGKGGEIYKLKRENLKRDWKDRIIMVPHAGPGFLTARRLSNMQIYKR
jgi:hypothetical protein